jgi:NAD(P)-dependent dehydrogenase (short-subunit alcohol dehydrogenase family)
VFSTAGVLHPERAPQQLDKASVEHTLATNVLGPLLVLKHLSPFVVTARPSSRPRAPSVWINISARVGSIADNRLGGWYSYRASKAAVNSITKTFDVHLLQKAGDGAMCVAIHPGTVKTELSREFWGHVEEGRLFEPQFAAGKILDVVMGLRVEDRGLFWDWKGQRIEW